MQKSRFDNRSKKEFKKDIKRFHKNEAEIALRLCYFKFLQTGVWPMLTPTGTDFTGEFANKASSCEDYLIDSVLVEITHAGIMCKKYFHEKIHKVTNCVNAPSSSMVFVNGFNQKQPVFIWVPSKNLEIFANISRSVYGIVKHPGTGLKPGYKFNIDWFEDMWNDLPILDVDLPEYYNDVIEVAGVK